MKEKFHILCIGFCVSVVLNGLVFSGLLLDEPPKLTPAQEMLMKIGEARYVLCDGGLAAFRDSPDGDFQIACQDAAVIDQPEGCYEEDGQLHCSQEVEP